MNVHEENVKALVTKISTIVNDKQDWKTTLTGNNELLEIVETLLNEVCHTYTEEVRITQE